MERFSELSAGIKSTENRMAEFTELKTYIVNYSKPHGVYVTYRKAMAGYSKKFLTEHESDIILHKAAKNAFNDLGLTDKVTHRQELTD